jgi:hypothetical protein
MNRISFDGKAMRASSTAPNGVIDEKTIFHFQQIGNLITAKYAGGKVKTGFLIGKMIDDKFEFHYTQMHEDESLNGGHSLCEIEITEDGRIRLIEHFEWTSGKKGINIIEEIA